tara:strand:+ start:9027 stop:9938 length:912 start_codon:yes stop_codon:yes gene_type:complete
MKNIDHYQTYNPFDFTRPEILFSLDGKSKAIKFSSGKSLSCYLRPFYKYTRPKHIDSLCTPNRIGTFSVGTFEFYRNLADDPRSDVGEGTGGNYINCTHSDNPVANNHLRTNFHLSKHTPLRMPKFKTEFSEINGYMICFSTRLDAELCKKFGAKNEPAGICRISNPYEFSTKVFESLRSKLNWTASSFNTFYANPIVYGDRWGKIYHNKFSGCIDHRLRPFCKPLCYANEVEYRCFAPIPNEHIAQSRLPEYEQLIVDVPCSEKFCRKIDSMHGKIPDGAGFDYPSVEYNINMNSAPRRLYF